MYISSRVFVVLQYTHTHIYVYAIRICTYTYTINNTVYIYIYIYMWAIWMNFCNLRIALQSHVFFLGSLGVSNHLEVREGLSGKETEFLRFAWLCLVLGKNITNIFPKWWWINMVIRIPWDRICTQSPSKTHPKFEPHPAKNIIFVVLPKTYNS